MQEGHQEPVAALCETCRKEKGDREQGDDQTGVEPIGLAQKGFELEDSKQRKTLRTL